MTGHITPPIPIDEIIPDRGRINENGDLTIDSYNKVYEKCKIGIYYDIYCVAIGKKPLAAVDLTSRTGLKFIDDCIRDRLYDVKMINKIKNFINN